SLRLDTRGQELPDQLTSGSLEIHVNLARHVGTDTLHAPQVLFARTAQVLDASEISGEQLGGGFANLRNAERVEEAAQGRQPALCDAVDKVLCRLVGEAFELAGLLFAHPKEVAGILDDAAVNDLPLRGVAEPLDVHTATGFTWATGVSTPVRPT